jgi:hypothetical protein
MLWINHEIPLSFYKHNFIIKLKELLFDKLNSEEFLRKILNIKSCAAITQSPPIMSHYEQMSLCHKFLTKLIRFLRKVSNRKKGKKETMEISFEEIPVSILVASCVMP